MVETNDLLKKTIGTKEPVFKKLDAKKVKIESIEIKHVEKAKSDKVLFKVKHPDSDKSIELSNVSYINDREIVNYGTWVNLDEDGNWAKNSGIAKILQILKVSSLEEAIGKEIETESVNKYLALKAY